MQFMKSLHFITVIAEEKSIRKAAEKLAITPSALNRRLLAIEDELSCPLFERLPIGVRLNTAGEIFVHHIKKQQSDLDRVRSQIADLEGMRRGHVSIACSQHTQTGFLVSELTRYRKSYPDVTFSIMTCERDDAQTHLNTLNADLALTLGPVIGSGYKTLATASIVPQALMRKSHPLATRQVLRFYECADYPVIMPSITDEISEMLKQTELMTGVQIHVVARADSISFRENILLDEDAISFHLPVMADGEKDQLVKIPMHTADMPAVILRLIQLENRVLSVAASKFAEQIVAYLETQFNG
jgi:DNA-binding transcriptional LysR family regulator